MKTAIATINAPSSDAAAGWINGLLGVLIFSGSLPATRLAVFDLDPLFLTVARAAIAGLLAAALLLVLRPRRPERSDIGPLVVTALGVVVGFPLLTAIALRYVTSAHAIVFVGLLPIATAVFGVLRGGERPRPAFWAFSILGALIVGAYALRQGGDASALGDGLMLAAILACGLGYAEGARLSRRLGGWQVISWALLISLPLSLPATLLTLPGSWGAIGWPAWAALGYVSLFSMLIGFIFWYRGLALGGIAAVGQLQLLQPFFGFALAAALLHEPVGWSLVGCAAAVVLCVAGAKRFAR
ncbi:drug/metabolite transporter (DMT)-like permease [Inquilinus ginsengisoli]|uniref:Drug/metabolite transporter (DMT)-like permease n=1 Tax=Inquilinus ginsengisoli TaxID=363840 RepID=A0ABU1JWP3_9PROT|nr:DMT family transporter [Inquilinus ginsengisoli]MDR6291994.1 drug/metabolite transporter (DMT)-like permease [Inquilinus ginsengisoli]